MAEQGDQLEAVRGGYLVEGPAIELGAAVADGTAHADVPVRIPLASLNRHGLVAGATGTGKTKTLQVIAEQLSAHGVPVFLADVKGDLSGIASPGAANDKVAARAADVGQEWAPTAYPTEILSLGGEGVGVPVRATITSFGPTLLAKVLGLNAVQESSLALVFHHADQNGLALLDLKDLRAVITHLVSDEGKAELEGLGGLSKATAGVILRELVAFAAAGADVFFGEPELDTADLLRTTPDGRGVVTCLELPGVQDKPALFSTFLMWMLADLFQELPEVGDLDKPKLVFFLDEAHLLFDDASEDFLDAITRTVRLIRSKGVGVFFVTQTPKDVPADVLAQLGNRVQHALRAYTPDDAKALKATVSTFPRSAYDLEELLTVLGTGEAVVTVLSERGAPTPVAWTRLRAPQSLMAPSDPAVVADVVAASPLAPRYSQTLDRESAYEMLTARLADAPTGREADGRGAGEGSDASPGTTWDGELPDGTTWDEPGREPGRAPAPRQESAPRREPAPRDEPSVLETVVQSPAFRSALRSAGTVIGREITRSLFGTARRRRRR
ncbi:DUF853 family protein [Actinotalea sp. AC32]|nr:DUF853 family protein [Actinotalea sp. AC32]